MDEGTLGEEDRLAMGLASQAHPRSQSPRPRQYQLRDYYHQQEQQENQQLEEDHYPLPNHHHHPVLHSFRHPDDSYAPPADPTLDDRPTQLPVGSYAAANLQAFATNTRSAQAFVNSPDPDEFYRSYRGVQTAANVSLLPAFPVVSDPMASAIPSNRQPTSVRTTSNGATAKHSTIVVGQGSLRSSQRSVSNPVGDKTASRGNAGAGMGASTRSGNSYGVGIKQPSVKDLKKRFDQSATTTNSPPSGTSRTASTRNPASRDASSNLTIAQPPSSGAANGTAYSSLRSGATRDSANGVNGASASARLTSPRGTQRQKFVPEDQLSNNSQSFASRISKPRNAISTNVQVSKSNSQLSSPPSSPTKVPVPISPASSRLNGLLFGEILPGQDDFLTVGYGIEEGNRQRRTSESSTQNPARSHLRSLSDPDAEPPSPTDWYRDTPSQEPTNQPQEAPVTQKTGHSRTQSDLSGAKAGISRKPLKLAIGSPNGSNPPSPTSRLPVRKFNNSSSSISPASTRSNSPSTIRRPTASGRTSRQQQQQQQGPPVSRAKTPTKRSTTPTTRAKTPNSSNPSPNSTRRAPPSNITTSGSNRLNAYVSVPQPKLSPTLRSSRPRQSVATAANASPRVKGGIAGSTVASRMRAAERGVSPHKTGLTSRGAPGAGKPEDRTRERRKLSVGPIDFAQRRETIKLAYSKSIKESQAKEARDAAAARRKRELEAVARRKVEAEAAAVAAEAAAAAETAGATALLDARKRSAQSLRIAENGAPPEVHVVPETPLEESSQSSKYLPPLPPINTNAPLSVDSPTFTLPGSFPALVSPPVEPDEVPQSAISTTSVTTEFDVEPQTEAPIQKAIAILHEDSAISMTTARPLSSINEIPQLQPSSYKRVSYHSPFEMDGMSDENASIKISLDTSAQPSAQPSPYPTPTRSEFEHEPVFEEDEEEEQEPEPESEPTVEMEREVESEPEPAAAPVIPGSFQDEYEPQPYTFTAPSYETTVTILGPETNFMPSHKDESSGTVAETNGGQTRGLSRESYPSANALHLVGAAEERPQSSVENLSSLEDFYVGPNLRDNIAALRESVLSDGDTSGDAQPSSAEYQKTPDTSHSLTVPPLLSPTNRFSQFSAWTDFSLESSDGRETGGRSSLANIHEPEIQEQSSIKLPPSAEAGTQDTDAENLNRDSQISSLDAPGSMLADPLLSKHRLPELDTGAGFSVPYFSREHLRHEPRHRQHHVPLPDHSPPPPPSSEFGADDAMYTIETRPNSYLQSQDGDADEELTRPNSTPQSISNETLEPTSTHSTERTLVQEFAVPGPSEKERKRLKQRQLVIRELIDTESIFIRDMTVVEEIYKGTAEACPKLDNKTVKLIFRNSDDVIAFHTFLLAQLKEGVSTVYTPKGRKSPLLRGDSTRETKDSDSVTIHSTVSSGGSATRGDMSDEKDRLTMIGPAFLENIDKLKMVHEAYLRTSDNSTKRLLQIQEDPTVMVWLNECNEVAKDLTSAWNLDSLLIKPMQRITKYPDIITHLLKYTPEDHPDRESLVKARASVMDAIDDINKTKKNFELVGQIVSQRKRKDSDVRIGIARAFGKRVDKLQASKGTPEDDTYMKLHEKFGDDYLRLQVVLRDVEFYTRQVAAYTHEFLQYLSSIELVMRLQPSKYHAHLEAKWVQFNVSMRDIEKIALEKHLSEIRKCVIEPFEQVIRCYANPATAMRKRAKRRLDHEKFVQLKAGNKKIDKQLTELNEQYEALNETLKKELPKLSELTAKVGNICLGKFVGIQASWYQLWQEKMKMPLQDGGQIPEFADIVNTFQREFREMEDEVMSLGILNPSLRGRASQSTTDDSASTLSKTRSRPSDVFTPRNRGLSVNSDYIPTLPTPDFVKRNSGQFTLSPTGAHSSSTLPSPGHYYRDYYSGINGHARGGSNSPITPEPYSSSRTTTTTTTTTAAVPSIRPSTGRSHDSSGGPRQSAESAAFMGSASNRRDSNPYSNGGNPNDANGSGRRFSGLFHSALPLPDAGDREESQRSSRASSRERSSHGPNSHITHYPHSHHHHHNHQHQHQSSTANANSSVNNSNGNSTGSSEYNVLWLAASLFEFNIETAKHEAGYPYLTYQAGEIFDVIAEKGELWLAKNQDDPANLVGWIWSKHFARLADS